MLVVKGGRLLVAIIFVCSTLMLEKKTLENCANTVVCFGIDFISFSNNKIMLVLKSGKILVTITFCLY